MLARTKSGYKKKYIFFIQLSQRGGEAPAYFVSPLKINYAANYLLRRGSARACAIFSENTLEGVFPLGICKAPRAKALRRNKL